MPPASPHDDHDHRASSPISADRKSPIIITPKGMGGSPGSDDDDDLERNHHQQWPGRGAGTPAGSDGDDDDAGLDGLSLYEKKCALINRELDGMGMGRYQWYIWGLCGFGYMLDLLWAQAFGLVLSPLQQEMGFGNNQTGSISTCFNAGLTAGAFVWGVLSDLVGRKWAFNLTCLFSSVFGLCLGASGSYTTFLVLTAFVGFGVGGNIPIDTTITLEFLPRDKRFLLAALSVFQPLGVVLCSALAFAFIPTMSCSPNFSEADPLPSCNNAADGEACCGRDNNKGWRYLLFTLGGLTLAVFCLRFLVFHFRESPNFLLSQGRDDEAVRVVQHIARTNQRPCKLTLAAFEALEKEADDETSPSAESIDRPADHEGGGVLGSGARTFKRVRPNKQTLQSGTSRYMMLFSSFTMARLTILVWLTYIFDFVGFTIAGVYLPRILALKNGDAHQSLTFTYASYIYTYAPGIFGVLLGSAAYRAPAVGRQGAMVLSALLMGLAILLFAAADTVPKHLGLFALEYFFQSMFNAVLYGWTPEAFPAPVRGTACGVASFWGRLFGIVSPLVAQYLYGQSAREGGNVNAVLYLAGGVTMGCVVTTALLPTKTRQLGASGGRGS